MGILRRTFWTARELQYWMFLVTCLLTTTKKDFQLPVGWVVWLEVSCPVEQLSLFLEVLIDQVVIHLVQHFQNQRKEVCDIFLVSSKLNAEFHGFKTFEIMFSQNVGNCN